MSDRLPHSFCARPVPILFFVYYGFEGINRVHSRQIYKKGEVPLFFNTYPVLIVYR